MENKYYTPTIEEFNVGFKYEFYEISYTNDWIETTFEGLLAGDSTTYKFTFDQLMEEIKNEHVRVKYLDKEDIESLGFELEEYAPDEWSLYALKSIYNINGRTGVTKDGRPYEFVCGILYDITTHQIRISAGNFNSHIGRNKFEGVIKNKSELIDQLKRCGIE